MKTRNKTQTNTSSIQRSKTNANTSVASTLDPDDELKIMMSKMPVDIRERILKDVKDDDAYQKHENWKHLETIARSVPNSNGQVNLIYHEVSKIEPHPDRFGILHIEKGDDELYIMKGSMIKNPEYEHEKIHAKFIISHFRKTPNDETEVKLVFSPGHFSTSEESHGVYLRYDHTPGSTRPFSFKVENGNNANIKRAYELIIFIDSIGTPGSYLNSVFKRIYNFGIYIFDEDGVKTDEHLPAALNPTKEKKLYKKQKDDDRALWTHDALHLMKREISKYIRMGSTHASINYDSLQDRTIFDKAIKKYKKFAKLATDPEYINMETNSRY